MYGIPVLSAIVYVSLLSLLMEFSQKQSPLPRTPAVALAIGLWFSTILSHIAHLYFQGVLNTLPETFRPSLFLILMLTTVDRPSRVRWVIIVFVLGAVMMSIHCLMQQRLGYGFGGMEPLVYWDQNRGGLLVRSQFVGIFGDPNDTGQMLAAAIPLVLAIPKQITVFSTMVCAGIMALLLMGVNSTGSRGAQIALYAVVYAMILWKMPVRWMPYLAVAGLIGGLVMCGIMGKGMLDASARERVVFWGNANQLFKHNPIFGVGYGMFWMAVEGDRAAHNAFVSCYTELGLVGYWCWFSLLQLGIIGCWRTRVAIKRPRTKEQAYMRRVAGMSMAAMIGFATGGYFLSRAWAYPFFFLFALLSAIPLIVQRLLPEDAPPLIRASTDVLGMGTFSTFVSVVYIYISILILNKAYGG